MALVLSRITCARRAPPCCWSSNCWKNALAAADRVYALVQGCIVLHAPTSEANLPQRLEELRRTSDALLIRVKSTRLLGVPVPNLIMGNVPKRAGVSGNAMAMKAGLTWDNVEFCCSQTGLPVIIKGILSSAQALEPERHGCALVWLSNHGGRQLDNTPSATMALPRVANALKGRLRPSSMAASIAARMCSARLRWGAHCLTARRLAARKAFRAYTSTSGTNWS
jgi:hypothetical protein